MMREGISSSLGNLSPGRDILSSLKAILCLGNLREPLVSTLIKTDLPEEQGSISSHILQAVDPLVQDKGIPQPAINTQAVRISLRPEIAYPDKRLCCEAGREEGFTTHCG